MAKREELAHLAIIIHRHMQIRARRQQAWRGRRLPSRRVRMRVGSSFQVDSAGTPSKLRFSTITIG